MAGGMDWFRWHHGSVTDPKFGLVAKKAQARVSDVIAMWALILESASQAVERGDIGKLDLESVEHLLGLDEGQADRIFEAMGQRGLVANGRVTSWANRQPKREREPDSSAARTSDYRGRKKQQGSDSQVTTGDTNTNHVTPCDATKHPKKPRGEESRREKSSSVPIGTDSAEPRCDSAPSEPPVITLPLIDKTEFDVSQAQVDEWSEAYPAVDVLQALRSMRQWCIANPSQKKTRRGVMAFATRWLASEQDKGVRAPARGGRAANEPRYAAAGRSLYGTFTPTDPGEVFDV